MLIHELGQLGQEHARFFRVFEMHDFMWSARRENFSESLGELRHQRGLFTAQLIAAVLGSSEQGT
jgi:hypothetical protein